MASLTGFKSIFHFSIRVYTCNDYLPKPKECIYYTMLLRSLAYPVSPPPYPTLTYPTVRVGQVSGMYHTTSKARYLPFRAQFPC